MEYEKEDLEKALNTLRQGGVILYPTDTVWGLGCDATNEDAVKRIFEIKNRCDAKSMLCLADDMNRVYDYVENIPDMAYDIDEMAIRPVTIIYDKARNLSKNLISSDGSIGIRVTREQFSKELCRRLGKPVVSTSANISGEKAPSFFNEVSEQIKNAVDYVVEYRRDDYTPSSPSQIIKLKSNGEVKVIRQ